MAAMMMELSDDEIKQELDMMNYEEETAMDPPPPQLKLWRRLLSRYQSNVEQVDPQRAATEYALFKIRANAVTSQAAVSLPTPEPGSSVQALAPVTSSVTIAPREKPRLRFRMPDPSTDDGSELKLSDIIENIEDVRDHTVLKLFEKARLENHEIFKKDPDDGNDKYIFNNQWRDAIRINNAWLDPNNDYSVISIIKRTKCGMDGLMIAVLTLAILSGLIKRADAARIVTGMSNADWQNDFIALAPKYLKRSVFHNNQLPYAGLGDIEDTIIIIDEVDAASKPEQRLATVLKDGNLSTVPLRKSRNVKLLVTSATMIAEQRELYQWGDKEHLSLVMETSPNYIGHGDFRKLGLIRQYKPLDTRVAMATYLEDDVGAYKRVGKNRVHIVRLANSKKKAYGEGGKTIREVFQEEAEQLGYRHGCYAPSSKEGFTMSRAGYLDMWRKPLETQFILFIFATHRRANLLKNKWKLKVGTIYEYCPAIHRDDRITIQALVGRMTGYWRYAFYDKDGNRTDHMAGPYYTSIEAIDRYVEQFTTPIEEIDVIRAGTTLQKDEGRNAVSKPGMFDPRRNGVAIVRTFPDERARHDPKCVGFRVFKDTERAQAFTEAIGGGGNPNRKDCYLDGVKDKVSKPRYLSEVELFVNVTNNSIRGQGSARDQHQSYYFPCYLNSQTDDDLVMVVKIQHNTDRELLEQADRDYPDDRGTLGVYADYRIAPELKKNNATR